MNVLRSLAFSPTYPTHPFTSQQLLTIQEELNNKKSELEQAKEEQSHTQALLKVLQEQVSDRSSSAWGTGSDVGPRLLGAGRASGTEVNPRCPWPGPCPASLPGLCSVEFIISLPAPLLSLSDPYLDCPSPPAMWESSFQKINEF